MRLIRNSIPSAGANRTGDAAVNARRLVLAYDGHVAFAVSDFEVPAGALTSLIGPNGSGKSTLLHAMAGLLEPRAGQLVVLGDSPRRTHKRVAYVFQATKVNEAMPITVREAVAMGRYALRGGFRRLTRDDHDAIDAAMERLRVADLRNRHLRELSGGERQRVFVAQGLAQQAELLLLDEPLTALDIPSHERIDEVVAEERDAGRTVVITTHDVNEAARGDHVLLLAGRVVAAGPPADVLTPSRLAEAYGADLLHVDEGPMLVDDAGHLPADDSGGGRRFVE